MKKILFISLLFLIACDEKRYDSVVVDKMYCPSQTSIGTGLVGTKMVTTANTTPEKYLIFFKNSSGEVIHTEVNSNSYFRMNKGNSITILEKWHGHYIQDKGGYKNGTTTSLD